MYERSKRIFLAIVILLVNVSNLFAQEIFVSLEGNDKHTGTKQSPVATIEKAWELAQNVKNVDTVFIRIEDGRYEANKMIHLKQDVSTSIPIVIKAVNPQKVIIAGGKALPVSAWKKLKRGTVHKILEPSVRTNIYQIDLKDLGITDFGTLKGRGFSKNVLPMEMELFFNNSRATLARWPNYNAEAPYTGMAKYGKMTQEGAKPRFGDTSGTPAKFIFKNNRIKKWVLNEDVWLHGVWAWDWADRRMPLLDVDTKASELTVGCSYYGLKSNKYFYVVNAIAELDSPGEYYIDRNHGVLYFWPPAPLKKATTSVSITEKPLLVLDNTHHVTIEGIIFQEGRSVGINIIGGSNNIIDNCIVRAMGSAAVNIGEGQKGYEIIGIGYGGGNTGLYERTGWNRNGGKNNGLRNCEIYDIAAYGVLLGGGDRKTLTPAGNFVENCNIHHVARVYEQMFSNVHIDGVGNRVSNCDLSFNPHSAIMFWGNNHTIEYNEIHHSVYNSSDAGAIYTGRDPSQTGTEIRWNFFHNIYGNHDYEGVFFDDGASGLKVHGNIFYDIQSSGATKYHGGQNNEFTNNIVVDCSMPVGYQLWNQSRWNDFFDSDFMENRLFNAVNILEEPYLSTYPWLYRIFDVPYAKNSHIEERNYVTSIDDPLFENGKELDFRISDWQALRDKVPGMQIVPIEKIGLKNKASRLISPVFYMKTQRLFPGHPFEIGPAKILEGHGDFEIYYTTDGSEPTRSSKKYSKAVVMDKPATIKARIYQKGIPDSLASNVKIKQCEDPQGTIFLDELYPTSIIAHKGIKLNHNYAFSNRVYLGGRAYLHSVMACPTVKNKYSELVYDLSFINKNIVFKSDFGIDKVSKNGSVDFIVKGKKDGKTKELFKSKRMTKGGAFETVQLDVSGYDELILIVTDGRDNVWGDHAVWGEARLEISEE
ncbi:NPCBM/NEW2 domain-containing protein [Flavivirga eckloniae]|uniref:Glycosyl hydrolase family 98 putative carbohydrate-binding module domain-containing protein n=1 Tax=Flavivirga eckloniae TaxID=1803846 RepID=A0A2K9PN13_9FLAO|nr:NPCBM/NEW2 domain-containing protein [Flavivirga eckloniae]AUP78440.1 hypothetical protein C1H87_06840 [Flavivirga eckloniae]